MTTLTNRKNAALLIIDVQKGVVEHAYHRNAVIANIGVLLDRARRELIPVVWVQHSDAWQIVPELIPGKTEALIEKNYGDAFENTNLEAVLSGFGVGKLFIVGAQTDACIRSTLHGALVRGYDVILVRDAHTTEDQSEWGAPPPEQVITHTNLYWTCQTAPGRTAGTVATHDIDFHAFGSAK
jgi:nicotinamidase-related amidase